jgi:hypothetical protein
MESTDTRLIIDPSTGRLLEMVNGHPGGAGNVYRTTYLFAGPAEKAPHATWTAGPVKVDRSGKAVG